mgnify:CR=1 FL=1
MHGSVLANMFDSVRGPIFAVVRALFVVVLIGLTFALGWSAGTSTSYYADRSDDYSQQHAGHTHERISRECTGIDPSGVLQCIQEIVEASRDAERREYDLSAQEAMARWSLWTSIASLAGVAVSLLAVAGVYLSLGQTRQALTDNRAMGEAELRAYIGKGQLRWVSHWRIEDKKSIFWRFQLALTNTGATPTRNLIVRTCSRVKPHGVEMAAMPADVNSFRTQIASKESMGVLTFDMNGQELVEIMLGNQILFIFCEVSYGNAINPRSTHITQFGLRSTAVSGDPLKYWHNERNPVNVTFSYIESFDRTD